MAKKPTNPDMHDMQATYLPYDEFHAFGYAPEKRNKHVMAAAWKVPVEDLPQWVDASM